MITLGGRRFRKRRCETTPSILVFHQNQLLALFLIFFYLFSLRIKHLKLFGKFLNLRMFSLIVGKWVRPPDPPPLQNIRVMPLISLRITAFLYGL